MNHVSPYIIDLCILLVIVGIGYVATAIAYGMGYKEGREDGVQQGRNDLIMTINSEYGKQGYYKPPF